MPVRSQLCLDLGEMDLERAKEFARVCGSHFHAIRATDLVERHGLQVVQMLAACGAVVWVDCDPYIGLDEVPLRIASFIEAGVGIISIHAATGVPFMRAVLAASRCAGAHIWADASMLAIEELHRCARLNATLEFVRQAREAGVQTVVCEFQDHEGLVSSPEFAGLRFATRNAHCANAQIPKHPRIPPEERLHYVIVEAGKRDADAMRGGVV